MQYPYFVKETDRICMTPADSNAQVFSNMIHKGFFHKKNYVKNLLTLSHVF